MTMVRYVHDNKLTKTSGWKWAKKCKNLSHGYVNLITEANDLQAQKEKYKFGIQVPDNPRHAYLLEHVSSPVTVPWLRIIILNRKLIL